MREVWFGEAGAEEVEFDGLGSRRSKDQGASGADLEAAA
jgi:hypothetical protein